MGSRSVGGLLLRPSTLTRLTLFRPASSTCLAVPSWSSRRTLTSSTPSNSAQPQQHDESSQDGSSQAPTTEAANPFVNLVRRTNAPSGTRRSPISDDEVSHNIDELFKSTNNSNFRRRGANAPPPTSAGPNASQQAMRSFGQGFSPGTGGLRNQKPFDFSKLAMPEDMESGVFSTQPARPPEIPESEKIYPRLNPSYGRKVELDPAKGRDIVRGLKMLTTLCYRNKVRADLNRQRFHERPGLKRKRLKSERWRARFKVGFAEVTSRVRELTKKGW